MSGHAEQFIGTLFRVLAERDHDDARAALLEAYQTKAGADREQLTERLLSDIVEMFETQLETDAEIDVLVTAIERVLDRFGTIIDATPVGILIVDDDGRIELWSDGAAEIFGWDRSEVQRRSYGWLCESPEDGTALLSRLENGERLAGVETRHQRKSGGLLDVRLWAAPFGPNGSGFNGAAFVISDISEQKRREQRLAVLNRVLRHNIRNEVTVAQGHLTMLAEATTGGEDHIQTIRSHLDRIVDLSDAARRVEQLQGETGLTEIDVADILAGRIAQFRNAHREAELRADLPESAPVEAHELLPYALDNLIDNGIEHNDDPRVVEVSVSDGPEETTVRIADNGEGLPAMERAVLTAETETPLSHSSGVGLWLARWIVRNSEGTITVDDGPLGGTELTIELQSHAVESNGNLRSV